MGRPSNKLDKKLDAETALQTLNLIKMSSAEVAAKIEKKAKETCTIEPPSPSASSAVNNHSGAVKKYIEIEELFFNYLSKRYAKKYLFERNIRIGKYCYDFIGVSKFNHIDLIFEIRYLRIAAGDSMRIYDLFERMYNSGVNYERIAHRNFRCMVFLITPKEELPRLEDIVETYCMAHRENARRIEIKCMAEKSL